MTRDRIYIAAVTLRPASHSFTFSRTSTYNFHALHTFVHFFAITVKQSSSFEILQADLDIQHVISVLRRIKAIHITSLILGLFTLMVYFQLLFASHNKIYVQTQAELNQKDILQLQLQGNVTLININLLIQLISEHTSQHTSYNLKLCKYCVTAFCYKTKSNWPRALNELSAHL